MDGHPLDTADFSANIRHLKVFESVAHLNGVRRASEECHLSQPAVTQAVAKLEKQLGVTLLDRRASGSYLNECGRIFHQRVARMFAQMEQALIELGIPTGHASVSRVASCITRSQIRSLVAIVENGSFAHAARALGVAQTSLQRAARGLERTLRTPLYVQTASGIMASPAATAFARQLRLALRELDSGLQEIEAVKGHFGGEIVVGVMLHAGSVVLASALDEFVNAHPNAHVRVVNGNAEEMLRCLQVGEVDFLFGLMVQPTPAGFIDQLLARTPFVIVARPGHPLVGRSHITLDDLADYDWVVGTPGACRRKAFEKMFAGRRRPQARIAASSIPTVRLLLEQSNRLSLLTTYELLHEDDSLTTIPFGPFANVASIGMTMRENWLPTQLQTRFLNMVRQRFTGAAPGTVELPGRMMAVDVRS